MIDVFELMDDTDFATTFIVRRANPDDGFANEGEWVPGTPVERERVGIVQPAKPHDKVDYLPEGERDVSAINVWSKCELRKSDGAGQESDIILFNGNTYRVAGCKPWQCNGFWYAIATEFKE